MKTFNIEIPDGYEIDQEKSTFEKIVFKETKKELPKSWEEIERIKGWFVTGDSKLGSLSVLPTYDARNTFETQEQAEAAVALAQLSQLRKIYRQGWVPDWTDYATKYCIALDNNKIVLVGRTTISHFLSFNSVDIVEEFLENFRDLIEKARPLMS